MQTYESIFIGVLSGVITACLLFVIGKIWIKILIPWYQRIKYQGVDISGRWIYETTLDESKASFDLTLEQNAHELRGHALVTKTNGQKLLFKAKRKSLFITSLM